MDREGTEVTSGERVPQAERTARTRQALVDAALRLFATSGYDATTTEEIADAAGVSPRTFFRYFPTKESVLFFGEDDFIRSFNGLYLAQPDTFSEFDAMRGAFVTLAPSVSRIRERIKLYRQAVASSLTLRGRELAVHEQNAAAVAGALARRRGLLRPDISCELMAAVGMLVVERAIIQWAFGGPQPSLGARIAEGFDELRKWAAPGQPASPLSTAAHPSAPADAS